jgi:transcriptional regulator with XRE-family HTH domain
MSSSTQPAVEATDTLGGRLRNKRIERGLSGRELARRIGISASLVSQIETGRIQPSVRTLCAIVNELGASFDDVFASGRTVGTTRQTGTEANSRLVLRADARHRLELSSGVGWQRLTARNEPGIEFLFKVYPPGAESSPPGAPMRCTGRQFGVVIAGELSLTLGSDEYVLGPGDSVAFDSATPHRLYNAGRETTEAVWVVLGAET